MKQKGRFSFSLIEVIIGLVLLAVFALMTVYNVLESKKKTLCKETSSKIISTLTYAWKLARITDAEVRVVFEKREAEWYVFLEADRIAKQTLRKYFQKRESLAGCQTIALTNVPPAVEQIEDQVVLHIYPMGVSLPEGVLVLSFFQNELLEFEIALEKFTFKQEDDTSSQLFPQEILNDE